MNLYDEEELKRNKIKTKNLKKIIVIAIIILVNLSFAIVALIIYRNYNPSKVTVYLNGIQNQDLYKLLDFQNDENGQTIIYVPIKEVASFFGYKSFSGEYNRASEEQDKCYVQKDNDEVAMFSLNSKTIYKIDLQNKSKEYDYCYTDKTIFENNGKLYTSIDGIKKGFNVSFTYDEKKKVVEIYTLEYYLKQYHDYFSKNTIGDYGKIQINEGDLQNGKAVFDGMLIVRASNNNKYGVVNISTVPFSFILEPKYDKIEYVQYSSDFIVESNNKTGILSKTGTTKVKVAYDELTLMDRDAKLYRTRKDNLYGVIDENEKVIIYPENRKIGIDVSSFLENGIKSGYIILNELIPVQREDKWGFYNIKGKQVTDFVYEKIGCVIGNSNNRYSLLELPNYGLIVVGDKSKYTFMDAKGDDTILPSVFDQIYMEISSGQISYYMTVNDKRYNVIKSLGSKGINEQVNEQN